MRFEYVIQSPTTIKTFLYEQQFSKKTISAIKQDGALLVNGHPQTVRYHLEKGDQFIVQLPQEQPSAHLIPFERPLTILYEDSWLLIVNKPKNQNSAPSREHPHESLVEQALYHMQRQHDAGIPHIVTRLDRQTMGIVVIAKSRHIHHLMSLTKIDKIYECICEGIIKKAGEIEAPIARHADSIIERVVAADGKYAKTYYWPLKKGARYTLCRVKLETGRTHQIRVHFKHIGHTLVGDRLYGNQHPDYDTQCLKCAMIAFVHPITHANVQIDNPTPDFNHHLYQIEQSNYNGGADE